MEKVFYIGPGLFIIIHDLDNVFATATVSVNGLQLKGMVEFEICNITPERKKISVIPKLTIESVPGLPVPIDQLHNKIGIIIQNYELIAKILGEVWLSGLLHN